MKFSIVIPTLNESAGIVAALERLRESSAADPMEIIVSDGGSGDGTAEAAQALADKVLTRRGPGRARQMHEGALSASGDILLFLHADTRLPESWRQTLEKAWNARSHPSATAFSLCFDKDERFYRFIAKMAAWRSRLTGVPLGDQAIAVWREDYFQVGGFPPVALMEEYYLIDKLRRLGPVRVLSECAVTSARRYEKNGRVFQALSNFFITALFYLGVPPRVLVDIYR
ncbi:MAG TPA: TIGR04283 family arsenosugar biosynthesis glycosyltransferase [Elusimicrobiota bacterium]|nr:TIGR04283 family arsenosugar biosynthesis glycosyltransferase [Elusimicrobiota bacterium]